LPEAIVNAGVGLGDGVMAGLTLGHVSGQDVRDLIPYTRGTNGGADECSRTYDFAYKFGGLDVIGAEWGAGALKVASYAANNVQAMIVGLRVLTLPGNIAPELAESAPQVIEQQIEQLEEVVSGSAENNLERPFVPPPGRITFRY
jgi:hypothetical protein